MDDIILKEIRYSFITDLKHFLKVTRKCNHNSSQKYIRKFRKIINNAIKNNWLDKDPFKSYRVKLKDTKRVFLTREELQALEVVKLPIKRLEQVRDVFIFCCYTGLSYVDVEKLTPGHLAKGHDGELWVSIDRTVVDPYTGEFVKAANDAVKAEYSKALKAFGMEGLLA